MGHGPQRGAWKGARDGGTIWWIAPSHPIAAEIWRDLKRACRDAGVKKNEVEKRIEFPNGGSVTVRSAVVPDSLVAAGLDGLVMDEAARVKEEAWYGSLRATLSDHRGWAMFISTPKGFNWFHNLFLHAQQTPDWAAWQSPTADNPLIPTEEIDAARIDSPRYFGQEYLAHFEQQEGAEWPIEYFPDTLWFADFPEQPVVSVIAVDPSLGKGEKRKGCFGVIVYAVVDLRGTAWCEAYMSQEWDGGQLAEKVVELYERRRPTTVLFEGNGGQEFLGHLLVNVAKGRGINLPLEVVTHSQPKEERIRAGLTNRLRHKEIRFRDTPATHMLVNQLRSFPVDEFQDGPDALEMAMTHLLTLIKRMRKR